MVLLVPLAVLLLGLVSTSVSHAASYFPLAGNRTVFGSSSNYAAVDEANFSMAPGEIRRVTDQLDISSRTGKGPEVDNKVICLDQNSNIIGPPGTPPVPYSNENYAAGGAATGTNYSQDHGHAYQWNVSTLIEAPPQNPPENYFCQLLARIDPPYRMTVLAPTTGETKYGTWLEVSDQNEAGAQQLQTPYCASNGRGQYSDCKYVGPARLHDPTGLRNPPAINVTWQPVDTWTAANYATAIDGIATFQITSCYHGTASCVPSEWGYTGFLKCLHHRCGDAAGTSHLDIDQLYPDGSVCKVNRAFSERVTGRGKVFLSESFDISNKQHHLPLYYHVSASVSQNCGGSRLFKVVLHIRWTAGNPVKIDGGNVNLVNANAPPPPRPKPTSVTLSCPGTGSPGGPIALSGALSPPLGNRPITIAVGNAASGSQTTTTQADGSYSLSYTPSQAGQYTFVASYGGESGYEASSSQQCTVTVTSPPGATATSLTLTCPTTSYTPGSAIPLSGALSPPLSNRTITITVSGAASSSIATTTRSDGSYTASYTPSHDGQYTFVASYAGESGYQPSSSPSCTVQVITP